MSRKLAVVSMLLLLSACGGGPPTHFFTLNPAATSGSVPAGTFKAAPIQVRDVQLPGALDRLPMVVDGPGSQVQVLGEDRWVAPLDELMRRALSQDLKDRLGESAVVDPGAQPPSGKAQALVLNVQRFGADSTGRVTLDTDWTVARGTPPKPAISRHAKLQVDAGSAQPDAVAQAMSQALGQLADQIATALR